ncbi:flagellar biosynthetic protein FliO [Terasakiella sp. SH-1]|uniref:FliO/MopB family protein n=1 Tax=Terasakiella sp. SH-1 TaxID=2560057 RepID=UPI0010746A49|nr:flagellar biosynthetic protein FliO [Terasakiella sp. SH-1]
MEITDYLRFVFALAFVVALIGLLAFVAKRAGMGYRNVARAGKRRLSISEVMPLDGKRRLVLVKRDDKEHLLVIGGENDLVVEQNIKTVDSDMDFSEHLSNVSDSEGKTS